MLPNFVGNILWILVELLKYVLFLPIWFGSKPYRFSTSGPNKCVKAAAGVPLSGSPPAADTMPVKGKPSYHVAIVGCGPAGIVAMKEFLAKGHKVTCFELNDCIGGVFGESRRYENCRLVSSNLVTYFSDFMYGDDPEEIQYNPTFEKYTSYLDTYMRHHKLHQFVKFNTLVTDVHKEGDKWVVGTRMNKTKNVRYMANTAAEDTELFDRVVICSGLHQRAETPKYPGMETFKGEICHLFDITTHPQMKGKRVVVVGGGEGASDMCLLASRIASKSAVSIRNMSGFIVPRYSIMDENGEKAEGAISTDRDTGRALHMNCRAPTYLFESLFHYWMAVGRYYNATIDLLITKWNLSQWRRGGTFWNSPATKNASIHTSNHCHGMLIKPGISHLDGHTVFFADGSSFDADFILLGTGWNPSYPFLEKHHSDIAQQAAESFPLYRRTFTCQYRDELVFLGLSRPAFGAMPPLADLQARWAAMVVSGDLTLPSTSEMTALAKVDEINIKAQYNLKPRPKTVDFCIYTHQIAEEIGCRPNLIKLFFTDFKLWYRVTCCPFNGAAWRLEGPGAVPEYARAALGVTPTANDAPLYFVMNCIQTSWFLLGFKLLRIPYFKRYRPATLFKKKCEYN